MQDRNVLASKLKLGQLILRKIIKIVATRCHIVKLKCIKFDFGWGSIPEPAGELTALPRLPSYIYVSSNHHHECHIAGESRIIVSVPWLLLPVCLYPCILSLHWLAECRICRGWVNAGHFLAICGPTFAKIREKICTGEDWRRFLWVKRFTGEKNWFTPLFTNVMQWDDWWLAVSTWANNC